MSDKEIALRLTELIYPYNNPKYSGTKCERINEVYSTIYSKLKKLN